MSKGGEQSEQEEWNKDSKKKARPFREEKEKEKGEEN